MSDRIRIMISSRSNTAVELDGKPSKMAELRKRMKTKIEAIKPFNKQLFQVWINEDEAGSGEGTTWDQSLEEVRKADILLVLYNGDPGWRAGNNQGAIGICHAELQTALDEQPGKVFTIALPTVAIPKAVSEKQLHKNFRDYFVTQKSWAVGAEDGDEVLGRAVNTALHLSMCRLVARGGREARRGQFARGEALAWSRKNFDERKTVMESAVLSAVGLRNAANLADKENLVWVRWDGVNVLTHVHAVPGAMTTAAASEKVGRPFHHDHLDHALLTGTGKLGGPVHVIACYKGITEQQAMTLLGRPDVTTVDAPFGILAADQVSKVQCLFLRECRHSGRVDEAVTRMFDWLEESGEGPLLASRAQARARIVRAIAKELNH